ncbi:MAG TPA: aldehyde dehydrogenase family protein [Acidimicrobiia bacterium]|nr:aldehyde dehydrogenase family protein [Acidimicrobiia bacterium]
MTVTDERPPTPATPDLDAPALVARLRRTFDTGHTRPLAWRRAQLDALRSALTEREPEILDALAGDLAKPPLEAWGTEIGFVLNEIDHVRKHLKRWTRPTKVRTALATKPSKARVVREPLGVVLIISPWNYPVQLTLVPLIGAIAAGNTAVVKPSEVAPRTSAVLTSLIGDALDTDAIAVVEGAVEETQALLAQRWDHIFYTGNGTVGRIVMRAAAEHLTPVTLELGGKSPVIVDASADLEVAARRIVWGRFLNAGQTCIAPDYVLVARQHEEHLLELMREAVTDFYGTDPKASPDYARIIDDRHFSRLVSLLDSGTAVTGGDHDAAERYLAPTVLRDVAPDSPAMQEEIFGPILPVLPVDSTDAAIEFVNERDKPLALYVFANDGDASDRVLARTSSGGACVNATLFHTAVAELPFGGVGESGVGAYHGKASFDTFTHTKSVLRKRPKPDPALAYPPYTARKEKLMRRFL